MKEWAVDWYEYERGWGSKRESTSYYDTRAQAEKAIRDYDAKYNTADSAPDWYIKGHGPRETTVKEWKAYEESQKPVQNYDI